MSGCDGTKKLKTDANASTSIQDFFKEQDKQEGQDGGEAEVEEGEEEDGHGSKKPTTYSEGLVAAAINPLENSLILNHLFKLCPAGLLANCRLVCKQWYQEALATWRTNFPIIFTNRLLGEDYRYRLVLFNPTPSRDAVHVPVEQFLEYCADPQNQCAIKSFRNITIECTEFSLHPEDFIQLWPVLGIHLTTLELSACAFNGGEEFRTIIFTTCPNLQSLKLVLCGFTGRQNTPMVMLGYREPLHGTKHPLKSLQVISTLLPISWLELFSHFQALTRFSFEFERRDGWNSKTVFEGFTDAIKTVRKNKPSALPFKLTEFQPPPDITLLDPVLQTKTGIGQELRLPITTLRINSNMMEAHVKHVLEFNAERLEEIKVTGKASGPLGPSFPCGVQLGKLTTLKIKEHLCENLEFLKYTPNLEYLIISGEYDTRESKIFSNSCRLEMATIMRAVQLKGLKITFELTDDDLAILFEWLPDLPSLELCLGDKQFGIVCGSWKNLTSLSIRGRVLTDAGVTGLDNLVGGDSKKKAKKPEKKGPRRPNITDLKNLKKFSFWSQQLTEASVYHGFLQVPQLREVKLCSKDPRDQLYWTHESRIALRERNIKLLNPCFND